MVVCVNRERWITSKWKYFESLPLDCTQNVQSETRLSFCMFSRWVSLLRWVPYVCADLSEENAASIFRVTEFASDGRWSSFDEMFGLIYYILNTLMETTRSSETSKQTYYPTKCNISVRASVSIRLCFLEQLYQAVCYAQIYHRSPLLC